MPPGVSPSFSGRIPWPAPLRTVAKEGPHLVEKGGMFPWLGIFISLTNSIFISFMSGRNKYYNKHIKTSQLPPMTQWLRVRHGTEHLGHRVLRAQGAFLWAAQRRDAAKHHQGLFYTSCHEYVYLDIRKCPTNITTPGKKEPISESPRHTRPNFDSLCRNLGLPKA